MQKTLKIILLKTLSMTFYGAIYRQKHKKGEQKMKYFEVWQSGGNAEEITYCENGKAPQEGELVDWCFTPFVDEDSK